MGHVNSFSARGGGKDLNKIFQKVKCPEVSRGDVESSI